MSSSGNNDSNNDRQMTAEEESLVRELNDFCQSKLLTEDGIHKILKRHKIIRSEPLKDYNFFFEACGNERNNEGIIRCLLKYFPEAVNANDHGRTPLHCACDNKIVTPKIIQLLIEAAPDSVRSVNEDGLMPLHYLCMDEAGDEAAAMQVLQFLIDKYPEAVRHADYEGDLSIHIACYYSKPPEFCRVLIDAAPDSVRMADRKGSMPLHCLCDCIDVEKEVPLQILELLIDKYPEAVRCPDNEGDLPIHLACLSKSPEFCQILIDRYPDSVHSVNNDGEMPLHILCNNNEVNEEIVNQNLKLLIEKYPDVLRYADHRGDLPIHMAASCRRSPEFCRVLIEAYPGSEQLTDAYGALPLHLACLENYAPAVKYLYEINPDGIHHSSTRGHYPIHDAIRGAIERDNTADVVEVVKFLLGCNPDVKLQKCHGQSLLEFACEWEFDDSNIGAGIKIIKAIYDAHPEAIEDDRIVPYIHDYDQQVEAFICEHLVYARQAKDLRLMNTPDDNGQLPLHTALQNNVRLGSIKLLVKGNPSAIRNFDSNGLTPLHIACEHHCSPSVVQYLLGLDKNTLRAVDFQNNTALHYACRGAKYETIALLLENHDAASVSKRNTHDKLPIELLWGSDAVENRESIDYTDSVFRLLKAYPETLGNVGTQLQSTLAAGEIENGKKRKYGNE